MRSGLMMVLVLVGTGLLAGCGGAEPSAEGGADEGALATRCIDGPVVYDASGNIVAQARCMDPGLASPQAYIQMKTAKNDKPFFVVRVHAANVARNDGRDTAVFVSELYESRAARENGMRAFSSAIRKGNFEAREAQGGAHYVVVKGDNGAVLATSGMYGTKAAATLAITNVKKAFKATDVSIMEGDLDLASGWFRDAQNHTVLKAANNRVMLTAQSDESAFEAHDLGAADRVTFMGVSSQRRAETCARAAHGETGEIFALTDNLAIETVVLADSAGGGVERRVFVPAITHAQGDNSAPVAEGNQFDSCSSAVESLERIVRILDSIPRG